VLSDQPTQGLRTPSVAVPFAVWCAHAPPPSPSPPLHRAGRTQSCHVFFFFGPVHDRRRSNTVCSVCRAVELRAGRMGVVLGARMIPAQLPLGLRREGEKESRRQRGSLVRWAAGGASDGRSWGGLAGRAEGGVDWAGEGGGGEVGRCVYAAMQVAAGGVCTSRHWQRAAQRRIRAVSGARARQPKEGCSRRTGQRRCHRC